MNEPNWTDVAQAIGAGASVVIAIIVLIQNWRIRTVTDVVNILSDTHNLQAELTIAQRIPFLRLFRRDLFNAGGADFPLWYQNIGRPYHNLRYTRTAGNVELRNGFWEWEQLISSGNAPGEILIAKFLDYDVWEQPNYNFICNLYFDTDTGEVYRQILSCTGERALLLSRPILVTDLLETANSTPLANH